jgi:hypothetical protein
MGGPGTTPSTVVPTFTSEVTRTNRRRVLRVGSWLCRSYVCLFTPAQHRRHRSIYNPDDVKSGIKVTRMTIATALAALALTGCMTVGSVPTEATRVQ